MIYLSLLLIVVYISYYIVQYKKIPNSLSATYYDVGGYFSLVILMSSLLILPSMFNITPDNYKFLSFLSLTGVIFVAFAPNFKEGKLVDSVHTWAAILSLIFSQIWVGLTKPLFLLMWIPIIIYILYRLITNKEIVKIKFWSEISMLSSVYGTLLDN